VTDRSAWPAQLPVTHVRVPRPTRLGVGRRLVRAAVELAAAESRAASFGVGLWG
jgi:hypothetical protein